MNLERQVNKIVPATNLMELRENLQVSNGLSEENMEYHVALHGKKISRLCSNLYTSSNPSHTFFIAGQRGNGKTTAIDYILSLDKTKALFYPISLDLQEVTIIDDKNFDIVEILFFLINEILLISSGRIRNKYAQKIKKIEEERTSEHKDVAKTEWSLGDFLLQTVASIGLQLKIDASRRETIRTILKPKVKELKQILDDVIIDFGLEIGDKKILLFIDGLDKIQEVDAINSIFNRENALILTSIQSRKIVTLPVKLMHLDQTFFAALGNFEMLAWRIKQNPLNETEDDETITQHKTLLQELIYKRIAPEHHHIIEKEHLNLAIEKSGGFIRQLIQILDEAIIEAMVVGSEILEEVHIQRAIKEISNNMAMRISLDPTSINILYHIQQHYVTPDSQDINTQNKVLRLLLDTLIIYNTNGTPCYFVNPIVENTVRIYGESLEKTRKSE